MPGIEYKCKWCGFNSDEGDLKKNSNGVGYNCPRCCYNMTVKPIPPFYLFEED